jgi:tetratricopeptide (TPR) repeat protein
MVRSFSSSRRQFQAHCLWFVLLVLLAACATTAAQQAPARPMVIRDQAEGKAYMDALDTQDPTSRAEALEAFAQQYPQSVVFKDALEQEMVAWQAAGDSVKVKKVAKRLLAADPDNVRVLGIVVALDRVSAMQGDTDALNEMCVDASGGMLAVPLWRKPSNMTDADFAALSKLMNSIFVGAEGFCAVEQKNYSQAKDWLERALQIDPANVQDMDQLAIADLESAPLDANGFWYCARAIDLAQSAAIPQDVSCMTAYCMKKYVSYHGAGDGWDALVAAAASQQAPPANFARQIKPAPAATAPPQK